VRLEPLELWLEPGPGPLRPQILAALRQHGEPLRWAITAVVGEKVGDPAGCEVASGDSDGSVHGDQKGAGLGRLRLEAVMLR